MSARHACHYIARHAELCYIVCVLRIVVIVAVSGGLLLACGDKQSATEHPGPFTQTIDAGALDASPIDASLADASPVDASPVDASPDRAPGFSSAGLAPSAKWPFFQWDKAQAFTYNLRSPGPGVQLRIFSESEGWNPTRTSGPVLTPAQAATSLRLLAKTQGQMMVSKCPFPRHGIIFYQGEVPVGSISVCFECGDIMIWPAYRRGPAWEAKKWKRYAKLMRAYDRSFPLWRKLFEVDLGLASDWKKLPRHGESQ